MSTGRTGPMADINERTVIRALYELRGEHVPVSAKAIAAYLKVDEPLVLSLLRGLKKQRIVKDVQRKGERVWTTWGER